MKIKYHLTCFGTFGSPNGYKQSICFGDKQIVLNSKSFDLNTNAIKLYSGAPLLSLRKAQINNQSALVFSLYSHALEPNSNREGTFIGIGLICIDSHPDFGTIINNLYRFLKQLITNNLVEARLQVNHSDQFKFNSKDIHSNLNNSKSFEIPDYSSSLNNTPVLIYADFKYCNQIETLKQTAQLLDQYEEIYITDNSEIVQFTQQKGNYKTIINNADNRGIESNLKLIEKEKREKLNRFIEQLIKLKETKLSDLITLQRQIQKENISIQEKLKKYNSKANKIKTDADQLNNAQVHFLNIHEKTLKELKENKISPNRAKGIIQHELDLLNNKQNEIKSRINSFVERNIHQNENVIPREITNNVNKDNRGFGINIFEVLTFVLAILLIGSWLFFIFSEPEESNTVINNSTIGTQIETLSSDDLKLVNDRLQPNLEIDTVVQIIFNNNPHDVKEYFSKHKDNFTTLLREKNESSFDKSTNGKYVYNGRALKNIPMKKE